MIGMPIYKFIFILGSFYLRKKKNFHIKYKENMLQNSEFPRTCTLCHSWRFVCCVSFVACKATDVSQTHQTKPPASLRRLKNLLITTFVLFH